MEKEKKKLLLVAISVGFFLLVTITAAIIILTPKANDAASSNSISYSSGKTQKNPWDEDSSQDINPQYKNIDSQEYNSIPDNKPDNAAGSDRKDGDNLIISLRSPSTAAVPDVVQSEIQKKPERSAQVVKAPEPAKSVPTVRSSAQTNAPKTTIAKPAAPSRTINDFWVQTGAFSAQVRAEDAREILASKGITSIIENREINGKIWYRVRLGPYTSEKEANHWLGIVKLIDGFGNSQIRQTVRVN